MFVRIENSAKNTEGVFVQYYKYKQTFRNGVDKYADKYYYWGIKRTRSSTNGGGYVCNLCKAAQTAGLDSRSVGVGGLAGCDSPVVVSGLWR